MRQVAGEPVGVFEKNDEPQWPLHQLGVDDPTQCAALVDDEVAPPEVGNGRSVRVLDEDIEPEAGSHLGGGGGRPEGRDDHDRHRRDHPAKTALTAHPSPPVGHRHSHEGHCRAILRAGGYW